MEMTISSANFKHSGKTHEVFGGGLKRGGRLSSWGKNKILNQPSGARGPVLDRPRQKVADALLADRARERSACL